MSYCEVSELEGKILKEVDADTGVIVFTCEDDTKYKMYHAQDCCESVYIEDINGDLEDLVGTPIVKAYKTVAGTAEEAGVDPETASYSHGDQRWTFYHLRTAKGDVTIRWYGTSNGYYSIAVDFRKIDDDGDQW